CFTLLYQHQASHHFATRRSSDLVGTLDRLPMTNRRKVGMTSNHHALYDLGYTRATMAGTTGCHAVMRSQTILRRTHVGWMAETCIMELGGASNSSSVRY